MTQYAFKFADTKVEGIFTFYYNELVQGINLLEDTIEMAQKVPGTQVYIEGAEHIVGYCNDSIARRMEHMQNMTKHSDGVVSRDVALTAAGTLAGALERCAMAVIDLRNGIEIAKKRAADKAARDAEEAQYQKERAQQENDQERERANDRRNRQYTPAAAKYPVGVTDQTINLILTCGYRKAAALNHPDCGGNHEAMVAINATNDYLKKIGRI